MYFCIHNCWLYVALSPQPLFNLQTPVGFAFLIPQKLSYLVYLVAYFYPGNECNFFCSFAWRVYILIAWLPIPLLNVIYLSEDAVQQYDAFYV